MTKNIKVNAAILIIGNEILSGRTQDTNTSTLSDLRFKLKEAPHSFGNCSMRTAGSTLYMNKPLSLRKATEKNLCQKLSVLGVNEGAEVYVTSEKLQLPLVVRISKP